MKAIARAFSVLASPIMTFALVAVVGGLALTSVVVPQRESALVRLEDARELDLRRYAALGLTDALSSDWLYGALVLLAGNLAAQLLSRRGARFPDQPPAGALEHRFETEHSDVAVEVVRRALLPRLGRPIAERVDRHEVTLVYAAGARRSLAPIAAHAGLVACLLGAASSDDVSRRIPRGIFDVRDVATGTVGRFDIAFGEPFQFFGYESRYFVRQYDESRDGLGPAIRLERQSPSGDDGGSFWIYLDAPPGFDARHRRGEVEIVARSMGWSPVPGSGFQSSRAAFYLLVGVGLFGLAVAYGARPSARVWAELKGRGVRLVGVSERAKDAELARRFAAWSGLLERALGRSNREAEP